MVTTIQIRKFFSSLQEYEEFLLHWTRTCAKINEVGRNAKRLPAVEKRARLLKIE